MLNAVEAELVAHVGGDPSAAEAIIIRSATLKVVRLNLLAEQMLDGKEIGGDAHGILAWSNGLRRDLEVLGLKRRVKAVAGGANKLVEHFAQPYGAAHAEGGE